MDDYLELFSGIRVNSRLYNLPVVMVVDGDLSDPDAPYRAGATAVFKWPDDKE